MDRLALRGVRSILESLGPVDHSTGNLVDCVWHTGSDLLGCDELPTLELKETRSRRDGLVEKPGRLFRKGHRQLPPGETDASDQHDHQ